MMRVLHVSHRYLPAIGGAERYVADLSEELVRRGHQVDVFTSRALDDYSWQNVLPPFERLNGVDVYRFLTLRRRKWVWSILSFGWRNYARSHSRWYEPFLFFGGGPMSPGMFRALLARGRRYDLVHLSCLVYGHVAYGYWAARWLGVPIVITPHIHVEQEATHSIGYQREALFGSDHVIAVTAIERQMLMDIGIDPWRVSVSGNGLLPEAYDQARKWDKQAARSRLGLPTDGFLFLFLGRKTEYKGWDLALDAFAALQPQHSDLCFLAIGPETDYSQEIMHRYQGLPGVHFLGAVSDEEKLTALAACDCLVLPSIGEAFGIVFLEAWIMGKPVIGARTLAVSSVIQDGKDGLLATPGDVTDLARCMARLATQPHLAQRMGAQGREKVLRRYTVPCIADRLEGIYLRVLRRRWREGRQIQ